MRTCHRLAGLMIMAGVLLGVVGCDQGSKALARSYLGQGRVVSLLGGVFVMEYVENQGAFLSLGAWLPAPARRALFIAFPLVVVAGMAAYVIRKEDIRPGLAAGLALVVGGGAGNLLDRMVHDGKVGDFLNLGIGSFRTGIFNLADLSIMAGCLLIILNADATRGEGPPES